LRAFTDELMVRGRGQHEPTLRTVTLATLHAEGLEWDHVHLLGLAEGLLPISYATVSTRSTRNDDSRTSASRGLRVPSR
jgi:superfamily I DNA/RNA helicase